MNHDTNLHDDDFFEEAKQTQKKLAVLGFAFFIFGFLLLVTTIYFFLAALGLVPPIDVIPWVPYV